MSEKISVGSMMRMTSVLSTLSDLKDAGVDTDAPDFRKKIQAALVEIKAVIENIQTLDSETAKTIIQLIKTSVVPKLQQIDVLNMIVDRIDTQVGDGRGRGRGGAQIMQSFPTSMLFFTAQDWTSPSAV